MISPFVILFAGSMGSSKTPLAHKLSSVFRLPILNNDAIRTEITEQLGIFDQEAYIAQRDAELISLLESNVSFIYDASIDRTWEQLKKYLERYTYRYFIISLDISEAFITVDKLNNNPSHVGDTIADHSLFLKKHSDVVSLHIDDETFSQRFSLCTDAVAAWIDQ